MRKRLGSIARMVTRGGKGEGEGRVMWKSERRSLTELDISSWHKPNEAASLGLPPTLVRAVDDREGVAFLERKLLVRCGGIGIDGGGGLSCAVRPSQFLGHYRHLRGRAHS